MPSMSERAPIVEKQTVAIWGCAGLILFGCASLVTIIAYGMLAWSQLQ